jgi:hypothetical protein
MVDEQLARVARARAAADAAKGAAAKAHAEGMAKAAEDGVAEQTKLMGSHQRTLDAINASADMETANWVSNMSELAKQEPNPGRWWDNQSGLGKALWALSLVFGSGYAAITPGAKNAALQMVQEEINRDMQLQANRLKQQMAVEEMRGSVMKDRHARNRSDEQDKYGQQLGRVMALQRAWEARAQVPGALDDQAAIAESQAWFEAQKLPLFESRRGESVAARSEAAQRAHQTALQQLEINAANDRQEKELTYRRAHDAIEDQRARDLAQIAISAKGPRFDQKGRPVDEHGIPILEEAQSGVGTNVVVMNPKTGKPAQGIGSPTPDGVARFKDPKEREAFNSVKQAADERYHDLAELKKLMDETGGQAKALWGVAGVVDPRVEKLLKRVGYNAAKAMDPRGIVTNADHANGVSTAMGFNPDGDTLDRAKVIANWDEISKGIGDELADMPNFVSNAMTGKLNRAINGDAKVVWQPQDLQSKKVPVRSELEQTGGKEVSLDDKPVTSVSDYEARAKKQTDDAVRKGLDLPSHDEGAISALIKTAESVDPKTGKRKVATSPAVIQAEAKRILSTLDEEESAIKEKADPWGGNTPPTAEDKARLKQIDNTRRIANVVLREEVEKATKTLKSIEQYLKTTGHFRPKDVQRKEITRRWGMTGAPSEIDALIEKYDKMDVKLTPLDLINADGD